MAESIKKLILFLQSNVRIKARYVSQVTRWIGHVVRRAQRHEVNG